MQMRRFRAGAAALIAGLSVVCYGQGTEGIGVDDRHGVVPMPGPTRIGAANVNQLFNVSKSVITKLDIRGVPGQPFEFLVPVDDQVVMVRMDPTTALAPDVVIKVQNADGSYTQVDRPAVDVTFRGTVEEFPGSIVSGSLFDTGFEGRIWLPDGTKFNIEPVGIRAPNADPEEYIIYNARDAGGCGGSCGTTAAMEAEGRALADFDQWAMEVERGMGPGTCGGTCVAQLGVDADFTYFQARGSSVANVTNRINSVISTANVQYETQVSITHLISTLIIRQAEPDPYSGPDIGNLLSQLQNHWQTQQVGVVRDVVELFTVDVTGGVIGLAFLSGVCNSQGFNVVDSSQGTLNCDADLSAHELGHNWSSQHCSCSSPPSTMHPSLLCALTFVENDPGSDTIGQISSFRNTRLCLSPLEGGITTLPLIDNFDAGTTIDTMRWSGVDPGVTINALAFNEPTAPNSLQMRGSRAIRTSIIDASQVTNIVISYFSQAGGSVNPPEINEDLVVEWQDSGGAWNEVASLRAPSPGVAQTQFTQRNGVLPPAASHSNLRIRWRNLSVNTAGDDWFIDNVNVTGTPALPGPFTLTLPANLATGVSQSPFFDWTNAAFATEYRIMVDDDVNFGSPRFNELTGGLSSYSTAGNPLNQSTIYFWKVQALNDNGQTLGMPAVSQFTTAGPIPGSFNLLLPSSGSVLEETTAASFAWAPATTANSYDLQFDDDADFSSPEVVVTGITVAGYDLPAGQLQNNTTYRWRVIARNAIGQRISNQSFIIIVQIPSNVIPGDLNCDGSVSALDCAPFQLAFTDPVGYATAFPTCDIAAADVNGDLLINAADIDAFCVLVPACGFCQTPAAGDMNCDGMVNAADCAVFELARDNPAGYATQFPFCEILAGDFTSDGQVTSADQAGMCGLVPGCSFCAPPACTGDYDGSGDVGIGDIAEVSNNWGLPVGPGTPPDADMDGVVGLGELAVVINNWGNICP